MCLATNLLKIFGSGENLKNDEFAECHVGAWKRTNEMHPRINIFHLAVSRLFTWTIKCTSEGENEFGSGENQRLMKTEKEVLNEPLSKN